MSNAPARIAFESSKLEEVALDIGRDMAAAETAIDEAITLAARLMARVPEARLQADLSAVVGQRVFDRIGGSLASLTAGRGEMVKVHRLLETLRRELNLPEISYGDKGNGPPPKQGITASAGHLRAVTD